MRTFQLRTHWLAGCALGLALAASTASAAELVSVNIAELARRMVEGGLEGYGKARHKVGKEIIGARRSKRGEQVSEFLTLWVKPTPDSLSASA